jgi:nickel-dependent lactate racemase
MTTYYAQGGPDHVISHQQCHDALAKVLAQLGNRQRILAIPPDYTRADSQAGPITSMLYKLVGDRLVDVLPALGTHDPMPDDKLAKMFAGVPRDLFRVHRWRDDIVQIGEVPAGFCHEATGGIYSHAWPVEVNKLVAERSHDLIVSIGQVVPHEVIGMANYNKNLFVGTGGRRGINESHYIGAVYGMERIMGRADNPLRQILNYAQDHFCADWPLLYVLTVVAAGPRGELVIRGLYIGDDVDCFQQAAELSVKVNFEIVDHAPKKVVVWLDEEKFHSTWLGNKAIYRTRMAIADGGELVVLAPGVREFGEDRQIDRLIYKYGYRTTPQVLDFVNNNTDLASNLSAAAHLIHGSSENRFTVRYCPGQLSRHEIEGVGYEWGDLDELARHYQIDRLAPGFNDVNGEEVFYVPRPALGLWATADRL